MNKEDRILITGGTGFIGTYLKHRLEYDGFQNVYAMQGFKEGVDLGLKSTVAWAFDKYTPDVVIHLACRHGGSGFNGQNPAGVMYENINMTSNVIEEACWSQCKSFIFISDIISYPRNCPIPYKESDLWNGSPDNSRAPYAITKRFLTEMVSNYHKEGRIETTTLILPEVYGVDDLIDPRYGRLVTSSILNVVHARDNGTPLIIKAPNNCSRDLLNVGDAIRAISLAVQSEKQGMIINVGSGRETTLVELFDTIQRHLQTNVEIKWIDFEMPEAPRKILDTSRAKEYLSFSPTIDLDDGILEVCESLKDNKTALRDVEKML
jgi:GDP-L-fucose synthase